MRRLTKILLAAVVGAGVLAGPPQSDAAEPGRRVIHDEVGDVGPRSTDLERATFSYTRRTIRVTFRTAAPVTTYTTFQANLIPDRRRRGGVFFLNGRAFGQPAEVTLYYAAGIDRPGRPVRCPRRTIEQPDARTLRFRVPVRCLATRERPDRLVHVGGWLYSRRDFDCAPCAADGSPAYRTLTRARF